MSTKKAHIISSPVTPVNVNKHELFNGDIKNVLYSIFSIILNTVFRHQRHTCTIEIPVYPIYTVTRNWEALRQKLQLSRHVTDVTVCAINSKVLYVRTNIGYGQRKPFIEDMIQEIFVYSVNV